MKTFLKESDATGAPKPKRGYAVWIELGKWFTAKRVDPKKFGPHLYDGYIGAGLEGKIGNCKCGCYMGQSSSSGPVDPFGACPSNPK